MNVDPQASNDMDAAFDERCRALLAGRSVTPPPPAETLFASTGRRSVAPLAVGALLLAGAGIGGWWWSGVETATAPDASPAVEAPMDAKSPAEAAVVEDVKDVEDVAQDVDQPVEPATTEAHSAMRTETAVPDRVESAATPERAAEDVASETAQDPTPDAEPTPQPEMESEEVTMGAEQDPAPESNAMAPVEAPEQEGEAAPEEGGVAQPEQGPRELTLPITVPSGGGH